MISSLLSSSIVQVGTLTNILDQWRGITLNRFVLNMVEGHHLQLSCDPPLFYNFRQFNIKAVMAHHSTIQMEVDELIAKGVIEP